MFKQTPWRTHSCVPRRDSSRCLFSGMHHVFLSLTLAASCLAATDLRLIEAVKDRNPKAVNSLLNEHVNVNAPQPDGATALAWAVYLDEADTVDLLLKSGT